MKKPVKKNKFTFKEGFNYITGFWLKTAIIVGGLGWLISTIADFFNFPIVSFWAETLGMAWCLFTVLPMLARVFIFFDPHRDNRYDKSDFEDGTLS